jgi:O-antigen ligase
MIPKADQTTLARILVWTAFFATLMVAPWSAYDPVNVPKLAVIVIGGFSAAGILASNLSVVMDSRYRFVSMLAGLFILDLLAVLLLAGSNFYQEFFGTFGRATGFLAYVSLTLLLLGASVVSNRPVIQKFSISLILAGLLSSIYGLFQSLGIDGFDWVNAYSPVIGFLGNPNFQSSFVGFSGVAAFAYVLSNNTSRPYRVAGVIYLALSSYVIYKTDSQQGFLVLLGGIGIVILIRIPTSKLASLKYPTIILGSLVVLFVTLGSLNKGPFGAILYKPSVTYRGDYWRAGWKMTIDHPFFGVGLDSYGDWYRRSRTIEATLRRGPEITSNAAHNVLLDFSSNGGFPLLFIYLTLIIYVIRSIAKILRRTTTFDAPLAGLIAVWFAYLAQSVISLNQLGLAVWGWIISGLIIGYEINTRDLQSVSMAKKSKSKVRATEVFADSKTSAQTFLTLSCGFLIGALLGLPPLIASNKYFSALKSFDVKRIEQSAYTWPYDPHRMEQVAIFLANNKLQKEAIDILRYGVGRTPDEYQLWRVISEIPIATPEQKAQALVQMKRLDPLNPNLK